MNRVRKFIFFVICNLSLVFHLNAQQQFVKPYIGPSMSTTKCKFHLYLLIGQSNMAGRGSVEAQDTIRNSRVLSLNKANQWVVAKEPVGFDKSFAGVGPGLAFGRIMASVDTTVTIGLIPCAQGGSGIDYWRSGVYWSQTNSYPLDYAIERAQMAMKSGILKGILWNQGEADCTPEKAVVYGTKLKALIDTLRLAFDDPNLPFVAAKLPAFQIIPNTNPEPLKQINRAVNELKLSVKYYSVIKSDNTTHKGDSLHYNSASARLMGQRYAKGVIKLLKQKKK